MKILLDFIKGVAIGISDIIPGFSGGTMAVVLNVYERLVEAISHFFSHPLKSLKGIWVILLGMVVGIVVAIFSVVSLLEHFPFATSLFFIGLVFGCIPSISPDLKQNKLKIIDIIVFIGCVVLVILIPLLNSNSINPEMTIWSFIIVILMGILGSAAMILPGVSGSMILMAFGFYSYIILNIKGFMSDLFHWNIAGLGNEGLVLLAFLIGVVIGLVFASKVLKYLFNRHPLTIEIAIVGLMIASPFAIMYSTIDEYTINWSNPWIYVIGFITVVAGFCAAYYMSRIDKKFNITEEKEEQAI